MAFKIQLRRDTGERWLMNNPVLLEGELGYELDTGYAKIGDGQTPWEDLDYFVGGTGASGSWGAKNFIDLIDAPSSYNNSEKYYVRVNDTGDSLEFISLKELSKDIDIKDLSGFTGENIGNYLRVKSDGSGLEFAPVGGSGSIGNYSNNNLMQIKLGGIEENTSFGGVEFEKILNALFYPGGEGNITNIRILDEDNHSNEYNIMEIGQSLPISLRFEWTLQNDILLKGKLVTIKDEDETFPPTDEDHFVKDYLNPIKRNSRGSYEWEFSALGTNEIRIIRKKKVQWFPPIFYGKSSLEILSNLLIPNLFKKLEEKSDKTEYNINFSTEPEYLYIALPEGDTNYDISGIIINGFPLQLAKDNIHYNEEANGLPYKKIQNVIINGLTKTYRLYRSKYRIKSSVKIKLINESEYNNIRTTGILKPLGSDEKYPVIDPIYGIDGLRNVNTKNELFSIPFERRRLGMIVGVGINGDLGNYYKLINDPGIGNNTIDTDWKKFDNDSINFSSGLEEIPSPEKVVIEGDQRINVTLDTSSTIEAKYTISIPKLISGGTASNSL